MAGCPRERRGLDLRVVLRHRLGAGQARAAQPGAPPDPRGSLRPRPREPGAPAPVRGRRVRGPVPRHRPPDRPVHVSPDSGLAGGRRSGARRGSRALGPGAPAHHRRRRSAAGPDRDRARTPGGTGAREGDGQAPTRRAHPRGAGREGIRPGHALASQRDPGAAGELRSTRCSAERSGVPRGLLGRCRGRDQLPALLRRQRPGGHPHGGASRLRSGSSAPVPADPRGAHHRAADRPSRRPLRPRELPRRAAGAMRARAGWSSPSTWSSRRC